MRSRSNNFTIDGSDNNDEDIGVRRQGFTSLVPQPIESVQEFHVTTLLAEPQFGRTPGAQADAVSRSGGNAYHGTLYGFFTNQSLRARDSFDLVGDPSETFPITRASDNSPILVDDVAFAPKNPVGGENPYRRLQSGFVIGGPIVKNKLAFFGSYERQDISAMRESNFAVPTVAERGLTVRNNSGQIIHTGDRGIAEGGFRGLPTSAAGNAFFSFFPFPNNPRGLYGVNTYTEVLSADATGNVFSGKLDWQNLKAFGKEHNLTARYNFTDDDTILPVTGGALFSSLEPLVRTQDISFIFDSVLSPRLTNQLRASYGRTHLDFQQVRNDQLHQNLIQTHLLDGNGRPIPFLLNSKILQNSSRVGFDPIFSTVKDDNKQVINTEDKVRSIGSIGQLIVSGYSPVGVDVFNFPQSRVNNVFQYADTLIYSFGNHQFTGGFDLRRVELDSRLDRNFRPLVVFTGAANPGSRSSRGIPLPSELQGRDFVSVGVPTDFTQTLAVQPDSVIELRSWQNYFFFADKIRLQNRVTLTVGATYQLNTVPTDAKRRIEETFTSSQVQDDPGLRKVIANRKKIYKQDNNNIGPYLSLAWDPFGKGATAIRAGYGIYYDQIPGAVVSQSRTVFPSFFTFNLAGINKLNTGRNPGLDFLNPQILAKDATLNTILSGTTTVTDIINFFNNQLTRDASEGDKNFARPDFVLPDADLVTSQVQHWGLTVEQAFKNDFLLSVAYVGTRGTHLLRFATPNLGPNKILTVEEAPSKLGEPIFEGKSHAACQDPAWIALCDPETSNLGSYTLIKSDANSSYHALQAQLIKRFSRGLQLSGAYTWSHAIDEVSDLFDLAGAPALPQNSFDLRAERADANFDIRHRFAYSVIWDVPSFRDNFLLSRWQLASIGTFQTGQPYSVLYFYDFNKDGNLTDRVIPDPTGASPNGILQGQAGRNLFRAPGLATVDLALNKTFRVSERQNFEFRTEVFNAFNRSNFGIPVNQVNFGGLGAQPLTEKIFVDTRVPKRLIQFALKYNF
jgi:hypothetical protein